MISLPYGRRSVLAVTLANIALVPAVAAQSSVILEEIVVTAQKRQQNLQDVGIAISAFSGDQMRTLGVKESYDIAAFTPGVHVGGALAGQNSQFTIRGVTQNDFNDIVEAPNAVYVDEGYIANSNAQTFAVFDIDRVEILKGPQGTLFGRNATGGLVHYITRKPSFDETEGFVDVEWGHFDSASGSDNADSLRLEAAVGGPLTDTVAGRIAVLSNQRDSYLDNIYPAFEFGAGTIGIPGAGNSPGARAGDDMGEDDTRAVRAALAIQASEAVTVNLSVNWGESDVSTGPYQSVATTPVFNDLGEHVNTVFTPGGTDPFGYRDPDGDDFQTSSDYAFPDNGNTETTAYNVHVEWQLANGITFNSVTFAQDYEKLLFIDLDSGPVNLGANYARADTESFTQEFRFNGETESMRWTAGFYYLNIDNTSANGLKFPENSIALFESSPGAGDGSPLGDGVAYDLGVDAELETDSMSLFGQLEYDLTEDLTLIAGLRIIDEEKDYNALESIYASLSTDSVHVGAPAFSLRAPIEDDASDTLWAGKIQLDWRAADNLLVYGGINRGIKAGSFNPALPDAVAGPLALEFIPYDEEVLTSYEVGFKSEVFGGNTRINGSVFYYDYQDYQTFLFVSVGGYVINADAETVGAELEIQSSPIDGLDLLFAAAWFDAEVQDVPIQAGSETLIDVEPTNAPPLQLTGLVRYAWEAFGGTLAVQTDVSYSDSTYYNIRNFDSQQFDEYTMVNASVSWSTADERWLVSLIGRNLTDERAGVQGYDVSLICDCSEVSYRAPAWYGLSLKYSL